MVEYAGFSVCENDFRIAVCIFYCHFCRIGLWINFLEVLFYVEKVDRAVFGCS